MANYISELNQKELESLFNAGRDGISSEPEYWIHNADEGISYCYECCKKEVKRLLKENPKGEYCVDGGYGTEGDSTPFCEICDKLLENNLTDYGCEAELDHFLENGFDLKSDDDCRAMAEVIDSRGWIPLENRFNENQDQKDRDLKYFRNLHKLCRTILENT